MRRRRRSLALLGLCGLLAACSSPSAPTRPPEDPTLFRVGLLLLDGVYDTELTAPLDVLHHAQFHTERSFEVYTIGRSRDAVLSFEGLRITPDHGLDDAPWPTVLVVPSGEHSMGEDCEDEALLEWLAEAAERAQWTISVCDGAFPLAAAGVLDGRQCTTFLGDADELARRHPELEVHRGPLFVVDGDTITGQGGARSFEPAMWLVERSFGAACAAGVARGLVLEWPLRPSSYLLVGERR